MVAKRVESSVEMRAEKMVDWTAERSAEYLVE